MTGGEGHADLDRGALDRLIRIGGQEFLVEMIDLFLEHAPERLDAARSALDQGDFPAVYRAAHSLKSTAGNLGARNVQGVAERIETSARAEDAASIGPLLEELARHYRDARVELEAERGRRKGRGE
jgi:HPt (histidine-containing phosphotransfer) domain-containing protein